jgi:lysophospholipase L1-like esterase
MNYLADIIAILKKEWPDNRLVNIVCHGHSVPSGYFKTPTVDTMNSYPHLLHAQLAGWFPNAVINVIVTAIGGENSESGAARFEQEVLTHRPDVLTIDYGLNDRWIGLEKARASWASMIEKALVRQIKVILLTPTGDLTASLDDANDPLNQQAEQIRSLAREYQIGLADSLAATIGYVHGVHPLDDLMSQGNHPNRRGHDLVVQELLKWFHEGGIGLIYPITHSRHST